MSYNNQWGGPFPSLHMWPVHETFAMKMIHLPEGQRIKVGRQTNAKSQPGERNAFFDSKVLSRLHAEIWEHAGKIYIKDIKSSNGTFVNGERLSPEGLESDPYELNSQDTVEFGIDIISDDNRTILHHKVAARVFCVFNDKDAALSARELVYNQKRPAAPPSPKAFSAGGKANGVSFDHVLAKLQSELAKSKETEADLHSLRSTMTDIQDTLGGGLPPAQNGSATELIPPQYRDTSINGQAAAFLTLQNQLQETQSSLNSHIERIRQLESSLEQHQTIRYEISEMREQIQQSRREMELLRQDDNASVTTVTDTRTKEELLEENTKLVDQVHSLSGKVTQALDLSQTLSIQHGEAMAALQLLTERVGTLENGIAKRIADAVQENDQKWHAVRTDLQEGYKKDRESWEAERTRMQSVVRDWEEASRSDTSESDRPKRKPRRRRKADPAPETPRELADGTATPTSTSAHHPGVPPSRHVDHAKEEVGVGTQRANQIPMVAVLVVAIVAGVVYYKSKE